MVRDRVATFLCFVESSKNGDVWRGDGRSGQVCCVAGRRQAVQTKSPRQHKTRLQPALLTTTMPPEEEVKRRVGDSQEVIEASFDLESSSLGLGSYEDGDAKGCQIHSNERLSLADQLRVQLPSIHLVLKKQENPLRGKNQMRHPLLLVKSRPRWMQDTVASLARRLFCSTD